MPKLLRQPPPAPQPQTWWAQPMTYDEFAARAKREAARMNAVSVAYNKPKKKD